MDTIRGPNSLPCSWSVLRHSKLIPVMLCTAQTQLQRQQHIQPEIQWIAPNSLQARSVFGPMPPFPTMTHASVLSKLILKLFHTHEVVGPTDTISYSSSVPSFLRTIGPAEDLLCCEHHTGVLCHIQLGGGEQHHGRSSDRRLTPYNVTDLNISQIFSALLQV